MRSITEMLQRHLSEWASLTNEHPTKMEVSDKLFRRISKEAYGYPLSTETTQLTIFGPMGRVEVNKEPSRVAENIWLRLIEEAHHD